MELEMPTQKLDRTGTKITIISNGDIFKSQCEALVNPVNTKGVVNYLATSLPSLVDQTQVI